MYKYIPQAGDTEIDELKGKIRAVIIMRLKAVMKQLASYHDNDYEGVKDNDEPYEDIYEFLKTLKNDKERLDWLLEYGEWEVKYVKKCVVSDPNCIHGKCECYNKGGLLYKGENKK